MLTLKDGEVRRNGEFLVVERLAEHLGLEKRVAGYNIRAGFHARSRERGQKLPESGEDTFPRQVCQDNPYTCVPSSKA